MESKVSITLTSYNVNGFSGSESFLREKCNENESNFICIQEHWLRPAYKNLKSINQLRTVHPAFDGYGVSAMKRSQNTAIRSGRPYGGTGFIFSKKFSPFLRPMIQYEAERMSVMKLLDVEHTIFIINVYFPFRQSSEEHRVEYLELLGNVESFLLSNPSSKFILTGDFNYNIFGSNSPICHEIRSFIENHDLICSHTLDPSFDSVTSYTRYCLKSGTNSLLDYILISKPLRDRVRACSIEYDGRNPSDHIPVSMQLDIAPLLTGETGPVVAPSSRINWSSLTSDVLSNYESAMDSLLDSLHVPSDIIHGNVYCSCEHHLFQIETYFNSLLSALETCDSILPRKSTHGKKGKVFWTENLSQLKRDSVLAYDKWQLEGRPTSGPSFDHKKHCHYTYKAELRRQQRISAAEKSEALGNELMDKNFTGFWKTWKRISQTRNPPVNRINDAVTEQDIASVFQSYFQEIFGENSTEAHRVLQQKFDERFPEYIASRRSESISPFLLTWDDMITITGKLKLGKSTNSNITAEHILHGSPKLIVHLHLLFNSFLLHGFVPTSFLKGTISPTVKNSSGNLNSSDNYRGITLCCTLSHLFENALRLKFSEYLGSDELQFGFKPKHSTNHAVYTLKSCINYFTKRDSNVYVAFLDFSKAFDTISHSGLFLKLMDRGVPLCFLMTIMFWYLNMEYIVKWASSFSIPFDVKCGTKQGGILSPDFFAIYINDLILRLKATGIGCHVIRRFIACLLFADDVSLIAPTRASLQHLLNICADYCFAFCLRFNVSKTKIMLFGKISKSVSDCAKISLNGEEIDYVTCCKYLGFHIVSDVHFSISITEDLRGFFGSVNSILASVRCPRENVQMQLLYSNCVPKLTYGAAVKSLNASETRQYSVAVNNAIRRIFGFRHWQSIRQIREFYGFPAIETIFATSKKRFYQQLIAHSNSVLRFLVSLEPTVVE